MGYWYMNNLWQILSHRAPTFFLLRLAAAISFFASCFVVCYHLVGNVVPFAGKMKINYDRKNMFLFSNVLPVFFHIVLSSLLKLS